LVICIWSFGYLHLVIWLFASGHLVTCIWSFGYLHLVICLIK
jgi:hypothetical protein